MARERRGVAEATGFRFEGEATRWRSKLTSKAQTVIPREVRERLGVGPGDWLVYRLTPDGFLITKAAAVEDDPFATFTEWGGAADDAAFQEL